MIDLPSVEPVDTTPFVEQGNLLLTLAGLVPGWYRVRDLYPRYLALEHRLENEPGTRIGFGMAIRRLGLDSRTVHGHAKAWEVTDEVLKLAGEMMSRMAVKKGWPS